MTDVLNVYADDWDDPYPQSDGWRANIKRLGGGGLGVSLYELPPGQTQVAYHFHYGNEEAILVLRGRPTLRMPDGERELRPGDVVHFPIGPAGAHQVVNRSDEPARYVIAARHVDPEVVEHVDSGKVLAMSRGELQHGPPLWTIHRLDDAVDYLDGEEPRA
jgi:uncharacterized cupin superfamily protein